MGLNKDLLFRDTLIRIFKNRKKRVEWFEVWTLFFWLKENGLNLIICKLEFKNRVVFVIISDAQARGWKKIFVLRNNNFKTLNNY